MSTPTLPPADLQPGLLLRNTLGIARASTGPFADCGRCAMAVPAQAPAAARP